MRTIYKDLILLIKNDSLLIMMIILLFSQLSGLFLYVSLILPIYVLLYSDSRFRIDKMALFIAIYSITYAFFSFINGWYMSARANVIFVSVFPPTFYLIGKYLGSKYKYDLYLLLFLVIVLLAIKPIVLVFLDISSTGQLISITRSMEFADGSTSSSATNIGIQLSVAVAAFGLLISRTQNAKEKKYKLCLVVVSLLSLMGVIHLINRTGLVIAAVSFVAVFIININTQAPKEKFIYIITSLVLFILVVRLMDLSLFGDIFEAYSKREIDGYDTASAGGRAELWKMGLEDLTRYPLGQTDRTRVSYAHNYWLDTAATAGLFPVFFLLIVTIKHALSSYALMKVMHKGLLMAMFAITNIGFFLTCLVEPVMEGLQLYVYLLFMFVGITEGYKRAL